MNKPATFISLLIESAQPDFYRRNPFRVLNLNVRSTASEIKKHLRKMEMEQNFGNRESASKSPDAEMVADAKERLENIDRRFIDEFFASWTNQDTHTEDNVFVVHDRAVTFHSLALEIETSANQFSLEKSDVERVRDDYWRKAINAWQQVFGEVGIWHQLNLRVEEMDDPRVTEKNVRELRQTLPLFLLMINARLAARTSQRKETSDAQRHVGLMKEFAFNSELVTQAIQHATEPLYNRINDLCKELELEARRAPEQADQAAERLRERARPILSAIDDLLPKEDQKRNSAFDTFASTMNTAIVIKSETTHPTATTEWEKLKLYFEWLDRLPISQAIRDMVNGNISWADRNARYSVWAGCWFCPKSEADAGSRAGIRLYKRETQNHYVYDDVWVPRCAKCLAVHVRIDKLRGRAAWVGGAGGVIICSALLASSWQGIYTFTEGKHPGLTVSIIIILALAIVFGISVLSELMVDKNAWSKVTDDIKPIKHIMNFPPIMEAQKQGWTTVKPT